MSVISAKDLFKKKGSIINNFIEENSMELVSGGSVKYECKSEDHADNICGMLRNAGYNAYSYQTDICEHKHTSNCYTELEDSCGCCTYDELVCGHSSNYCCGDSWYVGITVNPDQFSDSDESDDSNSDEDDN